MLPRVVSKGPRSPPRGAQTYLVRPLLLPFVVSGPFSGGLAQADGLSPHPGCGLWVSVAKQPKASRPHPFSLHWRDRGPPASTGSFLLSAALNIHQVPARPRVSSCYKWAFLLASCSHQPLRAGGGEAGAASLQLRAPREEEETGRAIVRGWEPRVLDGGQVCGRRSQQRPE